MQDKGSQEEMNIYLKKENINIPVKVSSKKMIRAKSFQNNEKLENINLTLILKKVLLILITFLYLFLTNFIGYLTSTLLIIPLVLYIFENRNFKKNLVISISGALIYYIFFRF